MSRQCHYLARAEASASRHGVSIGIYSPDSLLLPSHSVLRARRLLSSRGMRPAPEQHKDAGLNHNITIYRRSTNKYVVAGEIRPSYDRGNQPTNHTTQDRVGFFCNTSAPCVMRRVDQTHKLLITNIAYLVQNVSLTQRFVSEGESLPTRVCQRSSSLQDESVRRPPSL